MELLKQKIIENGKVLEGNVLGVDHFLSRQIDTELLKQLAGELHRDFEGLGVTKILTVESSGIAIGALTAAAFGVPLVFAKKEKGSSERFLTATVEGAQSFDVTVPCDYILATDRVLVIDDFLAKGSTMFALLELVKKAGAELVGCGVMIERVLYGGGDRLRQMGVRLTSLAKIGEVSAEKGIVFAE